MSFDLMKTCCFVKRSSSVTTLYDTKNSSNLAKTRMIPLKHIDRLNLSINNLEKINVTIESSKSLNNRKKTFENMFEVSGEFPTYITSLNRNDERIQGLDIQIGDYIIMVNQCNVSRASAKSVTKIINK
jgi:hypothetical protein